MNEDIARLHRASPRTVAARIAVVLALIVALHAAIALVPAAGIRAALLLPLGYLMVGAYVLAHELVHRRFSPWRWLDDVIGYVLLAPELVDFRDYRGGHLEHHRWVTTDRDPGFVVIPPERRIARAVNAAAHYAGLSYLLSHPWTVLFPPPSVSRRSAFAGVLKSIAPAIVALPLLGVRSWTWHVALPYVAFCLFNTIKNAAEHDYLYAGADGPRNVAAVTRSLRASAVTRFLWANCMYHVEHHRDPAVPFHNLPEMRKALALDDPSESYVSFAVTRLRRGVEYPFFI